MLTHEQKADHFALRAKHREFDDSDIEAVWDDAIACLTERYGEQFFGNAVVTDRCVDWRYWLGLVATILLTIVVRHL
jgi:hypothetical protein